MGTVVTKSSLDRTLARMEALPKVVETVSEEVLAEAGADVVERIISGELSSWIDQSGSLRSSVGGGVCRKGRIIKEFGFKKVLQGDEGAKKGRELLKELASRYARYDCVLIIVAGEEYAVYVEAIDGKVVLSSGLLHIEKTLPKLLRERINKALKKL